MICHTEGMFYWKRDPTKGGDEVSESLPLVLAVSWLSTLFLERDTPFTYLHQIN